MACNVTSRAVPHPHMSARVRSEPAPQAKGKDAVQGSCDGSRGPGQTMRVWQSTVDQHGPSLIEAPRSVLQRRGGVLDADLLMMRASANEWFTSQTQAGKHDFVSGESNGQKQGWITIAICRQDREDEYKPRPRTYGRHNRSPKSISHTHGLLGFTNAVVRGSRQGWALDSSRLAILPLSAGTPLVLRLDPGPEFPEKETGLIEQKYVALYVLFVLSPGQSSGKRRRSGNANREPGIAICCMEDSLPASDLRLGHIICVQCTERIVKGAWKKQFEKTRRPPG
ncbi:hypothetical protein ACRALDRAFT_1093977 [Sodiomyces alcalophilus JCM 7366]|uniref:uncharacterized protein n=1 Tax=Sodiomyces alcalophilus JCM 7366 TaxID=591952 RepID=UPI0039B4617C